MAKYRITGTVPTTVEKTMEIITDSRDFAVRQFMRVYPAGIVTGIMKSGNPVEEEKATMARRGRIDTLERLQAAANNDWLVVCPTAWANDHPVPAAVAITISGNVLLRCFSEGMYIYEKETD